jgi:hypothetical protein
MFEAFQRRQSPPDHLGDGFPILGCDPADAAGVFAHVVRVEELS